MKGKKTKKKNIAQLYTSATKGLQNYGRNVAKNEAGIMKSYGSRPNNSGYYKSANPFPNPFSAKSYQKRKPKMGVNNKLKGSYGETIISKGKPPVIKINVKKHKGDRKELADTIQHELMHAKHPKMHEKTVYKKTGKNISHAEQERLISKLRNKRMNNKLGAVKRKLKLGRAKTKPGELITKARQVGMAGLV